MNDPLKRRIKVRGIFCASEDQWMLFAENGADTDEEVIQRFLSATGWTIEPTEAVAFVEFEVEVMMPKIPIVKLENVTFEQQLPAVSEAK